MWRDGCDFFLSSGGPGGCWADVILEGWRKCGRDACLHLPSLDMKTTPGQNMVGTGFLMPEQMAECLPSPGHGAQVRQKVKAEDRMEGREREKSLEEREREKERGRGRGDGRREGKGRWRERERDREGVREREGEKRGKIKKEKDRNRSKGGKGI